MSRNRVVLAAVGGVAALAVLAMCAVLWFAFAAKTAAQEGDFAELKRELERARLDNGELEEKLARMGRSLAAARRARYLSTAGQS